MRKFSLKVEEIAQTWNNNPCDVQPRIKKIKDLIGSTAPYLACCSKTHMQIVVKPNRHNSNNGLLCAHEKIVADLAYHLNLPIAPIQIISGNSNNDFINFQNISLICGDSIGQCYYSESAIKGALKGNYTVDDLKYLYGQMTSFDTWINAQDRFKRHLVFSDEHLYFIDYGWSLSLPYTYQGSFFDDPENVDLISTKIFQDSYVKMDDKISDFDHKKIIAIVNRIPTKILPNNNKTIIINRLIKRGG